MQNGQACWTLGDLTGSITLTLRARVDSRRARRLAHEQLDRDVEQRRAREGARHDQRAREARVKGKLKRTAGVTG